MVKNSIGNGEAKELICMTHEHELSVGGNAGGREVHGGGESRGEQNGTTVIALSIKYIRKIKIKINNIY